MRKFKRILWFYVFVLSRLTKKREVSVYADAWPVESQLVMEFLA
jgi:hypothetical protein